MVLFPSSYRGRDVAGRLQGVTASTLMANAVDLPSADRARAEILGGTTIVEVALESPRPISCSRKYARSFEPEAVGGTAEAVAVDVVEPPGGSADVRVLERIEAAASGPSLMVRRSCSPGGVGSAGPTGSRCSRTSLRRSATPRSAPRAPPSTPGCAGRDADRTDGRHREARGTSPRASAARSSMPSA